MRLLLILTTMLTVAASLAATPAYAQSCQQLWVERNQYFNADPLFQEDKISPRSRT